MAKIKKRKLKDNEYDLGHGFILEMVLHPKGDEYGRLEGFLEYDGNPVDIGVNRFYGEVTEAMNDFNNRVIPVYINKNNIKVFKYLDDKYMVDFVKSYLLENRVTYGMVLDVITILKDHGYDIPKNNDNVKVRNVLEFYSCVDRLSKEFKRQLRLFKFTADRSVTNTVDHPKFNKHIKCRNIVFTRFPWSNGFKAISTINDFMTVTDNNLKDDIEMDEYKKFSEGAHKNLDAVLSMFNKINLKTNETLDNIGFDTVVYQFKSFYKDTRHELVSYWSKQQPVNYGVYPVE